MKGLGRLRPSLQRIVSAAADGGSLGPSSYQRWRPHPAVNRDSPATALKSTDMDVFWSRFDLGHRSSQHALSTLSVASRTPADGFRLQTNKWTGSNAYSSEKNSDIRGAPDNLGPAPVDSRSLLAHIIFSTQNWTDSEPIVASTEALGLCASLRDCFFVGVKFVAWRFLSNSYRTSVKDGSKVKPLPHRYLRAPDHGFTGHSMQTDNSLLEEEHFHELADDILHRLQDKIEVYGEDFNVAGFDLDHSSGVLTVRLGDLGTFVINKQTPNRQIWLSSPISGPGRFDWSKSKSSWIYRRRDVELVSLLEREFSELLGTTVDLS